MTEHFPFTPPPELVTKWITEERSQDYCSIIEQVAARAAQYAADQELEACCALLEVSDDNARDFLQSARRPKPPSLKEQAIEALDRMDQFPNLEDRQIIRRALEALDE